MTKKNYLTIGITILVFIIIIVILFLTNNSKTWVNTVQNSDTYETNIKACNYKEITLDKEKTNKLLKKWKNLSDNGPWTGNDENCYTEVTISYEKNNIIREVKILLIDDNSLAVSTGNTYEYYTNSQKFNSYINNILK